MRVHHVWRDMDLLTDHRTREHMPLDWGVDNTGWPSPEDIVGIIDAAGVEG